MVPLTTTHYDEDVNTFYGDILNAIQEDKAHFIDFKAKTGVKLESLAFGNFGIRGINESGKTLLIF